MAARLSAIDSRYAGREPVRSFTLPSRPPSALAPLFREEEDDGVLELPGLLQEAEESPDLGVGMGQETGEDLLLAGVHGGARRRPARPSPAPNWGRGVRTVPSGTIPVASWAGEELVAP